MSARCCAVASEADVRLRYLVQDRVLWSMDAVATGAGQLTGLVGAPLPVQPRGALMTPQADVVLLFGGDLRLVAESERRRRPRCRPASPSGCEPSRDHGRPRTAGRRMGCGDRPAGRAWCRRWRRPGNRSPGRGTSGRCRRRASSSPDGGSGAPDAASTWSASE